MAGDRNPMIRGETSLLIATDLDGSLLDAETYSFEKARPALRLLAERGIPLVLASSKTAAEMVPLSDSLSLVTPLIVENGGALLVPRGEREAGFSSLVLGARREAIVHALAEIREESGADLRSFSSLDPAEVARLTGLSPSAAELALKREYDEPFLLEDEGKVAALELAAERRGFKLTRGGRFWHLTGKTDKGQALRALLRHYAAEGRRFRTVGLGDAANDLSLLRAVDRPVVIPREPGRLDAALRAALPDAEQAPSPGPVGWNAAILAILRGETLPKVGSGGS
ncbi:MAG TPA: HAD-IIB family hydrolase [Vicinamibacteria bacterium]